MDEQLREKMNQLDVQVAVHSNDIVHLKEWEASQNGSLRRLEEGMTALRESFEGKLDARFNQLNQRLDNLNVKSEGDFRWKAGTIIGLLTSFIASILALR